MRAAFRTSFNMVGLLFICVLPQKVVVAHCDALDGPVVTEARVALGKGDVTPVLKWVPKDDEREIKEAFDRILIIRKQGSEARDLADMCFFEKLIRVHRAG